MVSRVHLGCLTAVLVLATVAASQVERGDVDRTEAVIPAPVKAAGEANRERAVADRPDRADRLPRLLHQIERLEVELDRQRREVEKLRAEVRRLKRKL